MLCVTDAIPNAKASCLFQRNPLLLVTGEFIFLSGVGIYFSYGDSYLWEFIFPWYNCMALMCESLFLFYLVPYEAELCISAVACL